MSKLKNKKYFALLGIVLLVVGIIGLFVYGKIDKYKGLIKVNNVVSNTTVLSASISNTVDQPNTSKGSDEIKYELTYSLDLVPGVDKRDVIITGKLSDEESKYARFKKIKGTNITSTLKNDGKEIEVELKDVPLGINNKITLKVIITNAPNEFRLNPSIKIKEKTSDEETTVATNEIEVSTETIQGVVKDENGMTVSNIELSLNKNGQEIKRTYTDENGSYILSDIENGTYSVEVEEEIYELVGNNIIENSGNLNLIVKEVKPYEIEAHKYITGLDLIVNGKETNYSYPDLEKVVEVVRNAKTISGEITYKIAIKNIGEKAGRLSMLKDKVDKGLSFDKKKNSGWVEKNGSLYYEPINNVEIKKGETREISLKLDIVSTNEIKTYINEIDANGETYEKVVYILNGVKYKEESVVLGEKIEEPTVSDDSFDGWYTDKNFTNKYKFDNEVTKDLILYGRTEVITHTIEFYDKNPFDGTETKWDEQEVEDGGKLEEPTNPTHPGYTFECWMDEHDNIWNFANPVERDMRLTSCYSLNRYSIVYKGLTDAEKTALNNPTSYTIEDTINITDANDRYDDENFLTERFIGWTGSNGTSPSKGVTFSHEIGDKEYTANFEHVDLDEYLITYVLNGGDLETGKTNPSTYTKKTPTFTLNNPSKPHYTFTGWTGSNGDTPQTTVTMVKGENEGDKEFIANYEPIMHNVTFNDKDPENPVPETVSQYGEVVPIIDGGTITPPGTNPVHTGYTCDKWSTKLDGNYETDAFDFSTEITSDVALYTLCKKNSYTVTYMDGSNQYAQETVKYKETATRPSTDPDHKSEHKIFVGWTLNNEIYDFNTLVTDNITLYARYEVVEAPVISHEPTEWTNQDVNVTVTNAGTDGKDYTGYTYKYRINNGDYQNYENVFAQGENCDVYAVAYKAGVSSEEVKHEITNIDKIKPTITDLSASSITKTGFIINIGGYDHESGLNDYKIYKDDQYITTIGFNGETETQNKTYTFTGLEQGTIYKIKVVATDRATNTTESDELEVETTQDERIVAQIIAFENTPLDEYIPLSSIYQGLTWDDGLVNCGVNHQCTIQMLDDVTESNDILEGQDITLDLNGFNVNGRTAYTFTNSGSFKVIDSKPYTGDSSKLMSNYISDLAATDASLVTDNTIDSNVRYVGSNPNNYIRFNGELWRIIGVMNNVYSSTDSVAESRLKIVRANSIGSYSWDSSNYSGNRGYGINEWSQADVMKLLNPGYEEENIGGSLYYNSASGSCYNSYSERNTSCDFSSTGLSTSAKNMIDPAIWYTGSTGRDGTSYYTSSRMYNYERGYLTGKVCSSGNYCTDSVQRTTSWNGYVGLISPSDYGYATSTSSCTGTMTSFSASCYNNDWLNKNQWTITPIGNTSYATKVASINNTMGYSYDASSSLPIYPVVYLKSDILYKSGTGTSADPYILMTDAEYQTIISSRVNGIKNSTDTAIINNGRFTLGNIEETNDVVLETKPYIEALNKGVVNNNVFNFYDGKIKGISAINGKVTDTPFPYNATIYDITEEDLHKQLAVLKVVTDPEARIDNVYYAKTQKALDDASKGYLLDTFSQATFRNSIMPVDSSTGTFIYDEEHDYYTNNGVAAKSYMYIDLTDYDTDQELAITTVRNEYSSSYIYVKRNSADGKTLNSIYINSGENVNKVLLEKGQRYYILFDHPSTTELIIKNITVSDYDIKDYDSSGLELEDEASTYSFDYDATTKSYISNNQYVLNSTAFSYSEIDLTTSTTDKLLLVSAYLETYGSDDIGSVRISETNDFNDNDYSSKTVLYLKGYYNSFSKVGPLIGETKLTKGKKYYLQFYYRKSSYGRTEEEYNSNNNKDQFMINNIRLIDNVLTDDLNNYYSDGTQIDLSTELKSEDEYGFTGSSYAPSNAGISNTVAHSYIKVDLTEESKPKYLKFDVSGYVNFELVTTESKDLPTGSYKSFINNPAGNSINTYYQYYYANLTPGRVNYVHLISRGSSSTSFSLSRVQIFDGEMLDLNTLKKAQSKGYGLNTSSSYYGMYTPLSINTNETADSYIKIDLTDKTEDQLITANMYLRSGSNNKYMYITTNEKNISFDKLNNRSRNNSLIFVDFKNGNSSYLYYTNGRNKYNDLYNYSFVLPKGNIYYLHFGTYGYYGTTSYYDDQLLIKSLKCQPVTVDQDFKIGKLTVNEGTESGGATDYISDETDDKNFRYIGKTPNNYVSFNNELWRIIGVFETEDENGNKDNRIKITRNDSFSGLALDSTPYNTTGSPVNGGQGINEWSQSDLMKLLNPGYDSNEEETFIYNSSDYSYTSSGVNNVNNSLYWNKQSGICINNSYNQTINCDFTSTGLSSEAKSFIDTVKWHTAAIPYNNNVSALDLYSYERGNNTIKDGTWVTSGIDDDVTRQTTWIGKVGLPYISDYILAAGDGLSSGNPVSRETCITASNTSYGACTSVNDWMTANSSPMTVISSIFGQNSGGADPYLSYAPFAATVYSGGMPASVMNYQVKPTVYLSTKTIISGGSGTSADPYTLTLGSSKNTKKNYGLDEDGSSSEEQDYHEETIIESDLIKTMKTYGFTLDDTTDEFVNENASIVNSLAASYFIIDLTNEEKDQEITFDYSIASDSSNQGYIDILKDEYKMINYGYDYRESCVVRTSGTNTGSYKTTLLHGSKYYIQLGFLKKIASSTADEFRVKLKYREDYDLNETFTRFDGIVPVLNEVPDTVHLLKDVAVKAPLRVDKVQKVILDLEGYTLSAGANNTYLVSNEGDLTIVDSLQEGSTTHTGNITNNNYSLIDNKEGGSLLVHEAILNTSAVAINNSGTVKMDENGIINLSAEGTGIKNNSTGHILEGTGTINAGDVYSNIAYNTDSHMIYVRGSYAIINDSLVDSELKGYHINKGIISSTSNKEYTINGINNPTGSIQNTNSLLKVKDTTVRNIVSRSSIELDHVTVSNQFYTQYGLDTKIKDSTIKEFSTMNSTNVNVTGSTINKFGCNDISGGTYSGRPSTPIANISSSTIGEISGNANIISITDNSTVQRVLINHGAVVLGKKDGNVSTTYPKIGLGTTTSIRAEEISFYDGIISGKKNEVISGHVVDVEDDYEIVGTEDGNKEDIYLDQPQVARIGDNEYSSLKEAVEAAAESEQEVLIEVIRNIYNSKEIDIPATKNINIDYSGFKVTGYSEVFANNKGILTISDSSNNPIYGTYTGLFVLNDGRVMLYDVQTNGVITNNSNAFMFSGKYDSINNNKNLTTTGGELVCKTGSTEHSCLNNAENSVAYIYDGIFNFTLNNYGSLNVTGGEFKSSYLGFATYEGATTIIDSIPIQTNRFDFYNTGTTKINNCKFQIARGSSNGGYAEIKNSEVSMGNTISNNSTLKIIGSKFTGGNSSSYNVVINTAGTEGSTCEIENSTFNTSVTTIQVGYSTSTGDNILNIKSGEINSQNIAIKDNGHSIITIGEKDGIINEDSPLITGKNNGINSGNTTSTINFYDGTITGPKNNSISAVIADIEEDSDIITVDNGNNTESKYLSTGPLIKNITRDIEYTNVQKAINESNSGDELRLLRDYSTTGSFVPLDISSSKNITFDMYGYSINYSGMNGDMFVNEGTLHFVNTKSTGAINNNTENSIFNNKGTLVIDDATETVKYDSYLVDNKSTGTATINNSIFNINRRKLVNNAGTMYLNNVTYNSQTDYNNNSPIENSGTLTIDCGDYEVLSSTGSYKTAIKNTGTINLVETISGETLTMNAQHILNNGNGVININAGNYIVKYVKASDTSTINFNGGYINPINIELDDSSNLNVTGGTIEQFLGYILNLISSESEDTTITIGTKDGTIDITTPIIRGGNNLSDINTSGTVNLYDGSVIGGSQPILASTLNIEDNSTIMIEPIQYVIEGRNVNGYSEHLITGNVVENVNTGSQYLTLNEAVSAASNNHTLRLLQTCVISTSVTIPSSKSLTLDLNGNNLSSSVYRGINNSGTFKIVNDVSGTKSIIFSEIEPFLTNDNLLEIDGNIDINATIVNNANHKFTLQNGTINKQLKNYGEFEMNGGIIKNYDDSYIPHSVPYYIVGNAGTMTINNGSLLMKPYMSVYSTGYKSTAKEHLIRNEGTITINDGTASNTSTYYDLIDLYGANSSLTVEDIDYQGTGEFVCSSNNYNATLTINGGSYTAEEGYIFNLGTAKPIYITGGTFATTNNAKIATGKINMSNMTISGISIGNMTGGVIDNVTATYSGLLIQMNGGTIKGNTTLTSTNSTAINNKGTLEILGNTSIISETNSAIDNSGTIILGSNDGSVSTTSPTIKGEINGIASTNNPTLKFYDGVISGKSNAYGITNIETAPNYVVRVTEADGYKNATLILDSDVEKVAEYNNINFPSLQSAINSCPTDGSDCNITILTNITLTEALTVPTGVVAKVYLNGHTVGPDTYITNHSGTGSIEIISGTPNGVGGAIYRFLASITGAEINPRDIIIYQMEDGSELLSSSTYKLYKLMDNDYKIIKVNETEIGFYELGTDTNNLRTTTGKINIREIGEGTYKLVGSDGKELEFEIMANGVSNNIRIDRYSSKKNVTATAIATLILQLQTGVTRNPYILIILLILLTISVGYVFIHKKQKDYE